MIIGEFCLRLARTVHGEMLKGDGDKPNLLHVF
jgi:hypothetical protein